MEMHQAHSYWASHFVLVEGEDFFAFLKTRDPEIQKLFIGNVGLLVGAPAGATYVQFKNACAELTVRGLADFALIHAMVSWVLAQLFQISVAADIDSKTEWLRGAAKWLKQQQEEADGKRKKTLRRVHAQAHQAIQEMTSNTLRNEKLYVRLCEELVAPLVAMNVR